MLTFESASSLGTTETLLFEMMRANLQTSVIASLRVNEAPHSEL